MPVILVVEDEILIRMVIVEILREAGYQVIEAVNGDEGISILLSGQEVDLLITDIRIPGKVDGLTLAVESKRLNSTRPVIVASGNVPGDVSSCRYVFIETIYRPDTSTSSWQSGRAAMADENSGPQCLIVADREVLVRAAISDYLRNCGFKVIEAAYSDEVITVLYDSAFQVDAVLSDATLGGAMSAFQLRIWVREHNPAVHFVLTGSVEAAAEAAGEMCDEGPHLKQPYDPQSVVSHIKRLLAGVRN